MRLNIITILVAMAIPSLAQSSSAAPAGASSTPAAASSPPATTSGFLSSAFPKNTAPTQANPSNNDITVSNGVTLTGGHDTAKPTGGSAGSSSASPGAAAPTAMPGMFAGGMVGMAALGVAALL